ncbi:hypothetical protein Tco_0705696 [Tanacetum coccineum]|uniref:Uncharacterized protein n=1 Tax=Tanacetum coccineum TaxID=301880 RepID=A0ABQ4Y5B8_9ASTR
MRGTTICGKAAAWDRAGVMRTVLNGNDLRGRTEDRVGGGFDDGEATYVLGTLRYANGRDGTRTERMRTVRSHETGYGDGRTNYDVAADGDNGDGRVSAGSVVGAETAKIRRRACSGRGTRDVALIDE